MNTKYLTRRPALLFVGLALGMTILCSCRGTSSNTAGMKIRNNGDQAYVISDRPLSGESLGGKIFPRLSGMRGNQGHNTNSPGEIPANQTNNTEIIQTAYNDPMPPPADDCPPVMADDCPPMMTDECPPTGPSLGAPLGPPGMEQGIPLPYDAYPPWSPDGLRQPWPADEYLRDGGDRRMPTGVNRQWQVRGLEMEDAVAHYDTVDGRRIVEPSNEVFIYAPRFGAVRQVVGVVSNEQREFTRGVTEDLAIDGPTHTQLIGSTAQQLQPGNQIGARPTHAFVTKQGDGAISTAIGPRSFQDAFKPYEDIAVLRTGQFDGSEALRLAKSAEAAVSWNETQAVQVIINRQTVQAAVKDQNVESVYNVEFEDKPALRLIKVASTAFANPGDEVSFTLRFDNLGNQVIGNVTILDSLSTRLEYVEGSAQCSREATFTTEPNEGGSTVLRCELKDPLEATQGGLIRFRCVVR